jgi:hypothetical protein
VRAGSWRPTRPTRRGTPSASGCTCRTEHGRVTSTRTRTKTRRGALSWPFPPSSASTSSTRTTATTTLWAGGSVQPAPHPGQQTQSRAATSTRGAAGPKVHTPDQLNDTTGVLQEQTLIHEATCLAELLRVRDDLGDFIRFVPPPPSMRKDVGPAARRSSSTFTSMQACQA